MRVLVIANPTATAITARERRVLANAVGAHSDLTVEETANRGHAAALACRAMRERVEVVIALGGDGTVNEVVNGVLTDGVHPEVPSVGIVPAGSTNVFARALGLPADPVGATDELMSALREDRRRVVSLGRVDHRWFTFAAGVGFDAEVVRRVEKQRRKGHRSTHLLYVRTALRTYAESNRRRGALTIERPDGSTVDGVHMAIVANTTPWTFLGRRPVTPTPAASLDEGLDLYARRRMGLLSVLLGIPQIMRSGAHRDPGALIEHDLAEIVVRAEQPIPVQVDGDYLGARSEMRFTSVPKALSVLA